MLNQADYEELRIALERFTGGTHNHSAGKAEFYLYKIIDKPKAKFSNCTADEFIQAVRTTVYSNDWKPLENLMSRWW